MRGTRHHQKRGEREGRREAAPAQKERGGESTTTQKEGEKNADNAQKEVRRRQHHPKWESSTTQGMDGKAASPNTTPLKEWMGESSTTQTEHWGPPVLYSTLLYSTLLYSTLLYLYSTLL